MSSKRAPVGGVVALVGLIGLTTILTPLRDHVSLASVVLLYLLVVVATAVVGGLTLALAAAVASDLVVNFFFVPPFHTFSVERGDQVITLIVYVLVGITVSLAMDLAARQRAAAARTGVEAELLARISAEPVGIGSTAALLEHVRQSLHMDTAALLSRDGQVLAVAGAPFTGSPMLAVPADDGLRLVAEGPSLFAPDLRFVTRLAKAAARSWHAEDLVEQAAQARELAEVDRLRSALLAAVGHDLRTPLASIKAGTSSLRDPELPLTAGEQAELVTMIDESADRMTDLVENLLAMSRLQAGALSVHPREVALDEVVASALLHQPAAGPVEVDVPDDLPLVRADPGLLERVVANLLANARPSDQPVRVTGRFADGRLELSIVDHGPGVAAADRERVFAPFQRLDDRTNTAGLGLGLAIARGFTEAMDGSLTPHDTPGGGLTMTISLPAVAS